MRRTRSALVGMILALSLGLTASGRAQAPGGGTPPQGHAQAGGKQRIEATKTNRPDVEKQRREAEQQAQNKLDQEAATAVEETRRALAAINDDKPDAALSAIESATGKMSVLLARNPATALIPAATEVEVIDVAPEDTKAIRDLARTAEKAVGDKNFPAARAILFGLSSEIRVRTYDIPLVTYPAALKDAARLLDAKKTKEAGNVLHAALNSLVVVDRVIPLPLVLATTAIDDAQAMKDRDRDGALRLVGVARHEIERAKELGYSGNDPEYQDLDKAISDVEKQIKGREDATSAFTRLKDRVSAFFKRQSETERR